MKAATSTTATNKKCGKHNRGDRVCVKTHTGELAERLVWDAEEDVILVCTGRVFEEMKSGNPCPPPSRFPIEDVVPARP